MRWPRDVWLDAVMDARLRPLEKLVAVVYSRHAGPQEVAWVSTAELLSDTSLSRNAARAALRGLVNGGWLQLVERERQQRAARYRMAVPPQGVTSGPPEGVTTAPAEFTGGHLVTPSGGHLVTPGGHLVTPGGPEKTPNHVEPEALPTTTTVVDDLWLVVVDNLPQQLADGLTRSQRIDDALGRHADEGWTADSLGAAVRGRGWRGAQGGAVVHWLTNLTKPGRADRAIARPGVLCPMHRQSMPCIGCAADLKAAS